MKLRHKSSHIPCKNLSTLVWEGDHLVDATTSQRLELDGTFSRSEFLIGFPFDRAISLRDASALWAVTYDNRGTKALLFRNGKAVRELNRSLYHAKAFDYPMTLTKTASGRGVIVHCPRDYDELVFEDAETGEILGAKKSENMEFHSRLAVSPDGGFLVSAGWFWHPLNGAWLCPISDITGMSGRPPKEADFSFGFGAEIDSVAFLQNDHLVVATSAEIVNGPLRLGVWSIGDDRWNSTVEIGQVAGAIMPWRDWVISFYEHPKAIELATGAVVHSWEHIYSGRQIGAIDLGEPAPPPIALDPVGGRFAIAGQDGVAVITLECAP